ncbi:MAG: FAD binding domain-containing protein [Salinivirgaceae bacterium]
MIRFILNNELVQTDLPEGSALVDFIRYEAELPGTKIGCREGDCGACTVLEGSLKDGKIVYKSIVSCLTPLRNAQGKHIVTLEGINMQHLSPVQKAMVDNAATQCGFCTPGFVMSFTGQGMSGNVATKDLAIDAVSGNICRCTGYKSIERAAQAIAGAFGNKNLENPVEWMVEQNYLPDYFLQIPDKLQTIANELHANQSGNVIIGGGTDLMVQKHDEIAESSLNSFYLKNDLKYIKKQDGKICIGAACTANDIGTHKLMRNLIPEITSFFKLVSSEPIRNTATIAGNIVNASPIGDLSIMLLAMNADVVLNKSGDTRKLPLKSFFLDYKKIDRKKDEFIEQFEIQLPKNTYRFNYEKISKRIHLDIASVTTAMSCEMNGNTVVSCHVSAGGVKAIPLYLEATSRFLEGKEMSVEVVLQAAEIIQSEISPISDVRGTDEYKRQLLRQLFIAHCKKLFPESVSAEELLAAI